MPAWDPIITRYKWTTHSYHPCRDCSHLRGQIRTMQQWTAAAWDRIHDNCRCTLEPVSELENGAEYEAELIGILYFNLDGSIGTNPLNPEPAILDPYQPGQNI